MKKIRFLSLFMLLLLLCACTTTPDPEPTDTEESTAEPAVITLCKDGKTDFRIVLPDDPTQAEEDAAKTLYLKIQTAFSTIVPITNDTAAETACEILIGQTARTPATTLGENEILIKAEESKIIICAARDTSLKEAIDLFWSQLQIDGKSATIAADLCLKTIAKQPETEKKTMTIKIATYNIANGRDVDYDYSVLAQDILDSGASIVGLQEVDQRTNRNGGRDTMAQLARFTGWEYYYFVPTITPYQGGEYGIALLSKYPITSTSFEYLPKLDESEETRAVLFASVDIDGVTLNCFVSHCQQSSISNQLTAISRLAKEKTPYAVMGDFNYQNFSLFHTLFSGTSLANDDGNRLETTVNKQAFDNMIFSKGIIMGTPTLIQTGHSDHHMLITEITVTQ